jgi:hypothetical protein
MKYLAHFLYIAPVGTYSEEENKPVQSLACTTEELNDAIDFCHEQYDGKDYFKDEIEPDLIKHFESGNKMYHFRDIDTGQEFCIMEIGYEELTVLGNID